ncbi:MAG: hypothetical protein AB1490_09775 [Pseudomonadota bacterium]
MLPFPEMLIMLMPPSVHYRRRIAEEVDAGEPELDLLPELVVAEAEGRSEAPDRKQMQETTFRTTQVHEAGPA